MTYMKNDPIKELLDLAEDLIEASATKPQKVPDDVMAKLNHRLFGDPLPPRKLTKKETDSLLLMLIGRRGFTAVELLEVLKHEGIAFDQGDGIIFGYLQRLEKQAFVAAEWETRGERRQQVYKLTDDGRNLLKRSSGKVQTLNSLADQIAARFASA